MKHVFQGGRMMNWHKYFWGLKEKWRLRTDRWVSNGQVNSSCDRAAWLAMVQQRREKMEWREYQHILLVFYLTEQKYNDRKRCGIKGIFKVEGGKSCSKLVGWWKLSSREGEIDDAEREIVGALLRHKWEEMRCRHRLRGCSWEHKQAIHSCNFQVVKRLER